VGGKDEAFKAFLVVGISADEERDLESIL